MSTLSKFQQEYGPWAPATGASSGIGFEFAKQIAARKLNVVLVATREVKLQSVAKEICEQYDVDVKVVVADLTVDEGIETAKRATGGVESGIGFYRNWAIIRLRVCELAH